MATREELAQAERDAWQAFMEVASRVPQDRRDDRTVVPGWSAKDLVWHNAYWALFGAEELARQAGAPFVDPFAGGGDDDTDRENAEQVESGRALTWDEVLARAEQQRARVHELWSSLDEVSDEAAAFFAEESSIHYDEHREEIERFLEG